MDDMWMKTISLDVELVRTQGQQFAMNMQNMKKIALELSEKIVTSEASPEEKLARYEKIHKRLDLLTNSICSLNLEIEKLTIQFAGCRSNSNLTFNYPAPRYELYSPGYKGVCTISHTFDDEDNVFFILDNSDCNKNFLNAMVTITKTQYDPKNRILTIPEPGTVFGILIHPENFIFRVVRNDKDESIESCSIYYLDTGEIHQISSIEVPEIYNLSAYYQAVPAQAIKCILAKIDGRIATKADFYYLQENNYRLHEFEVISIVNNVLQVELLKKPNPFLNNNLDDENDGPLREFKITKETLTAEQREDLYAPVETTSNAIKALSGYVPKDDRRLCPHYNPKTRACWKGAHCRLEHSPIIPEGYTKDTEEINVDIRAKLILPATGQELKLLPTVIESVEYFYAHIIMPQVAEQMTLNYMVEKMNSPAKIQSYRRVGAPSIQQLVVAKYDENKCWYRAQIIEVNDDNFEVLYVDYGNRAFVDIDDLRQWDNAFDYMPYQATRFRIANVEKMKDNDVNAARKLTNMILDKVITAIVVDSKIDLLVNIYDTEGFDIGEQLVSRTFAKHKQVLPTQSHGAYPG